MLKFPDSRLSGTNMNHSLRHHKKVVLRRLDAALVLAALICLLPAEAQAQNALTNHVRSEVTRGEARFLNAMPSTQSLRLDVVLPLRDQAGLDQFRREIEDRFSPSYRHFLSVSEFTARFGPSQEDYD